MVELFESERCGSCPATYLLFAFPTIIAAIASDYPYHFKDLDPLEFNIDLFSQVWATMHSIREAGTVNGEVHSVPTTDPEPSQASCSYWSGSTPYAPPYRICFRLTPRIARCDFPLLESNP
jgi:hypothetical protein